MNVACRICHREYPETGVPHRCLYCGGIYDQSSIPEFTVSRTDAGLRGMWKYRSTFGLPPEITVVSLGEGSTPLVEDKITGQRVAWKLEYLNPSSSYKDRGSSLLVSFLKSRGVRAAVEDSSGNAGASFAAYAARAGIQATIFVPQEASGPKRTQVEIYGAEMRAIPGPRSAAAEAVIREVAQGAIYASHAYLPFGVIGR